MLEKINDSTEHGQEFIPPKKTCLLIWNYRAGNSVPKSLGAFERSAPGASEHAHARVKTAFPTCFLIMSCTIITDVVYYIYVKIAVRNKSCIVKIVSLFDRLDHRRTFRAIDNQLSVPHKRRTNKGCG